MMSASATFQQSVRCNHPRGRGPDSGASMFVRMIFSPIRGGYIAATADFRKWRAFKCSTLCSFYVGSVTCGTDAPVRGATSTAIRTATAGAMPSMTGIAARVAAAG